jgi:hypothetical protein
MIISIDSIQGNSGQGNDMYSRSGKATVSQYLAFNNKPEMAIRETQKEDTELDELRKNFPFVSHHDTGSVQRSPLRASPRQRKLKEKKKSQRPSQSKRPDVQFLVSHKGVPV